MKFNFSHIQSRKQMKLPIRPTSKMAEIIGIMLGDGCLYQDKKQKFHTCVSFHKKELNYLNYVNKLFEEFFHPYKFYINEQKNQYLLVNVSKAVGQVLLAMNMEKGNKVHKQVIIPEWVFNHNLETDVLRGFFDTDGCVYRKYDDYAQIQFKFGSLPLIKSVRRAITKFKPTKIEQETNKKGINWKFYLSKQKEIDNFFRIIKPANQKHVLRYLKIRNGAAGI